MRQLGRIIVASMMWISLSARADVPPPDACSADDIGKPCSNAQGEGDQDGTGVCKATTCTRMGPAGEHTYDCFKCMKGATTSEPKPAPADTSKVEPPAAPIPAVAEEGSSSGCHVAMARPESPAWPLGITLALGACFGRRRRRAPN